MRIIGKIPRWLLEKDPSWERLRTESDLPEWIKKGSDLRAKCGPADLYCEIAIEDRSQSFISSASMLNLRPINTSISPESDLKRYLSSRYLNPGLYGNNLGLPRTRKLW